MAFEDDLGYDHRQPKDQDYTLSAPGLVSKTLSLLASNFVHYIIIVGIIGVASVIFSFVLLYTLFATVGMIGGDPIGYFVSLFFLTPSPAQFLVVLTLGFGIFAFILNATLGGAAIKFTLDEYGGTGGDIGDSFSHSFGRLLNLIIVQLVTSSIVAICIVPPTILAERALAMIGEIDLFDPYFPPGSVEMLTMAMIYFIVGGIIMIYLQIRLAPTLAIVIDTDLSAIDSLKESWELTSDNLVHVFGGMLLFGIVSFVLGFIVSIISDFTFLPLEYLLVIDSILTTLFFGALSSIYAVVLYRDLASRKDTSHLPGYVM